jgi:hypothetical protein
MSKAIDNNKNLLQVIPEQAKLNDYKNIISSIENGKANNKDIQELLKLNNNSAINSIGCKLGKFPKDAKELKQIVLNSSNIEGKAAEKEATSNLEKFVNCLSVNRPDPDVVDKNIYKDLLASEEMYQAQYEAPLNMARQSILAGELDPKLNNKLDESFKALIVNLKNDNVFTKQIDVYSQKLKNNIKSSIEQKGENPLDAVYPLFNACLQLNSLRYKNDTLKDGLSSTDASTITAGANPAKVKRKHFPGYKKNSDNFSGCDQISCVLPMPTWGDGDKDKVKKWKEMSCGPVKNSDIFKQELDLKLDKIKHDKALIASNPSGDTYISKICESKEKSANIETHDDETSEVISK